MRRVSVVSRKWDGSLHRDSAALELGTDQHGSWLWMPEGSLVRAATSTFRAVSGLRLIPVDRWWSAYFVPRHVNPARPKQLYVDIATPATRSEDLIEFIDLDLDVEQLEDGPARILDQDEFAAHQADYGYPPELVERAQATCAEIVAAVNARAEPFGTAHLAWLARAHASPATYPAGS